MVTCKQKNKNCGESGNESNKNEIKSNHTKICAKIGTFLFLPMILGMNILYVDSIIYYSAQYVLCTPNTNEKNEMIENKSYRIEHEKFIP